MAYRVELEHQGRLIEARWTGRAVRADIVDAWFQVLDRAERVGADRILALVEYSTCLGEAEAFEATMALVQRVRQMPFPVRIARVFFDEVTELQREFTQHTAFNRGIQVRTYGGDMLADARRWLYSEGMMQRKIAC